MCQVLGDENDKYLGSFIRRSSKSYLMTPSDEFFDQEVQFIPN